MSELTDELRQHALMCANKLKRVNPDGSVANAAYARVKTFAGEMCPWCWVSEGLNIKLEIEARATEVEAYCCNKCSFRAALPNPIKK